MLLGSMGRMREILQSGTPVEVVRPVSEPSRGVVLSIDIWGLRPLFDDLCAKLAAEHGWAVAAVEPYPRLTNLPFEFEPRLAAADTLRDEDVLGDLVAAADLLGTRRTAVIGFCMGGMYAMKAASLGRFDRAVAFLWSTPCPCVLEVERTCRTT